MNAQVRIEMFELWKELSASKPDKFRIVRLNREEGTFGLEMIMDKTWTLIDRIPVWDSANRWPLGCVYGARKAVAAK